MEFNCFTVVLFMQNEPHLFLYRAQLVQIEHINKSCKTK